jgi:aerobic carbon-monoxide dehydrogenase small subunit
MKKTITVKINSELRTLDVDQSDTLLMMLRETAGVKSPKIGCERGDCGSCTVLLDDKSVRSCLVLAVETDSQHVKTVEGLCEDGLTPLQEKFIEYSSFQCGFCASGVLISATELLEKNPNPSKEEVKETLSGNLCRCTGYEPIVEAVLDVNKCSKGRN